MKKMYNKVKDIFVMKIYGMTREELEEGKRLYKISKELEKVMGMTSEQFEWLYRKNGGV